MKNLNFIILLLGLLFTACQQDFETVQEQIDQNNLKKEALWMIKSVDKKVSTRAVAFKEKVWRPGDTIRIKFLNDPYNLEEQVKQTAAKWLKYVNLYFKYVGTNEEADVKIGFSDDRYISWSTIGTDCREIAQDSVSLNFSGFGDNLLYEPQLITSDILRGFGHILGLGFEYKNPLSTIEFNENVTDEDIYDEYRLSPEEIKEFRQLYDSSQTNYTSYDRFSIMCINIPRALVPRSQATHYNIEFSKNDTLFIKGMYPYLTPVDTLIRPIVRMVAEEKNFSLLMGLNIYSNLPGDNLKRENMIQIDWGDGIKENFYANQENLIEAKHQYSSTSNLDTITIYGTSTIINILNCNNNDLIFLDVTNCLHLRNLDCSNSQFRFLDVTKNKLLRNLWLDHNYSLEYIDLTKNVLLEQVSFWCTSIRELNLTQNEALYYLNCKECPLLTSLDLRFNESLWSLVFPKSGVASVILGNNPNLYDIDCQATPLEENYDKFITFLFSVPDRKGRDIGIFHTLVNLSEGTKNSLFLEKNWNIIPYQF